jgi:hypothetical protein
MSPERRHWLLAGLLALLWGLGPALPALLRGELIGQPFTDLYPAVWGLHWFASHQPGLPTVAAELAWPEGMGFYYSSPLHGWLAWPLLTLGLPLAATWNLLIVMARVAGPLLAFAWLRAEGAKPAGALAGAAVFGCAPMFHGYAVEGIVEGTDAWTLPLWGLLVARRRLVPSILAAWLVIASSWYLGLAALLVAVVRAREHRLVWISMLGGLLLAAPLWWLFSGAFPAATPLPSEIRAAMGVQPGLPTPGVLPGLNPFAITGYLGWLPLLLFMMGARRRPWLAGGAALCWLLALGAGPWYALPGLAMVRFPYRLVAASLFLAAPMVATVAERWRWGGALGFAVALEFLLLSPVEPILPSAPLAVPRAYSAVEPTVLLEIPGPVAMPPGEINRSRPRARYLLYYQAAHGAASPWAPDFNGVAGGEQAPWLASWRALDPLETSEDPARPDVRALEDQGLTQVMLHPAELGGGAELARRALTLAGWACSAQDDQQELWVAPSR